MTSLSFTPIYHRYHPELEAWVRDYSAATTEDVLVFDAKVEAEERALAAENATIALVQPSWLVED